MIMMWPLASDVPHPLIRLACWLAGWRDPQHDMLTHAVGPQTSKPGIENDNQDKSTAAQQNRTQRLAELRSALEVQRMHEIPVVGSAVSHTSTPRIGSRSRKLSQSQSKSDCVTRLHGVCLVPFVCQRFNRKTIRLPPTIPTMRHLQNVMCPTCTL